MKSRWTAAWVSLIALGGCSSQTDVAETAEELLACTPSGDLLGPNVLAGTSSAVPEISLFLNAGTENIFETNVTSGDPVLHILNSQGVQVASNDDSGPANNSRIVFTPTQTGTYRILMRAYSNTSSGVGTVTRNGTSIINALPFGGWAVRVSCLRQGEQLQTVLPPGGAGTQQVIYMFKANGLDIESRTQAIGASGSVKLPITADLGTRTVIVAARTDVSAGAIRLVRNDVNMSGHDTDGDGLGSELEAAIGTCTTKTGFVNGFNCALTSDARDTDGDGLSDGAEVLGVIDESPAQTLPKWGADPRHKDLFLEVDFMQTCPGTDDAKMAPAVVRELADYYADRREVFDAATQLQHAQMLRNPDSKPGINLHVDTGQNPTPENPQDLTLYGDWGGHNPVARIVNTDPNSCGFKGQDVDDVWQANLAKARRGLFHYALGYTGGGGSAGEFKVVSSWSQTSSLNAAHEFGHSLGIGHSGPSQAGFADPNCKPTWPSIMNYAYHDHNFTAQVGFSDGLNRPAINNVALVETNAVATSDTRYLDHLQNVFKYNVDRTTGNVDWNRDGEISTSPVRAYANFAPGGAGCEWTRYNNVTTQTVTRLSPALARLTGQTFLWSANKSDGRLTRTTSFSSFDCPVPGSSCNGASFAAPIFYDYDASRGVDAVRLTTSSGDRLMIVRVDAQGKLWNHGLSKGPGGAPMLGSGTQIPATDSGGEPSLAVVGQSSGYLAYKDNAGLVRFRGFDNDAWGPEIQAQIQNADGTIQPMPSMSAAASPAIAYIPIPFAGFGNERQLYGAFANSSGRVQLYRLDQSNMLWTKINIYDTSAPGPIASKPVLAWVPRQSEADSKGQLYMFYSNIVEAATATQEAKNEPRMRVSHTLGFGGTTKLGLDSPFDNIWSFSLGLAAMYEPGIDQNLRLAYVSGNGALSFRPKADGINDYELKNESDWAVFRVTLCQTLMNPTLHNPDPEVQNPITCHPITWLN
jgi:hypothetical protein